MKKRWSATLLASLLLFLLNWGVWAYSVIVEQDWQATPIGPALANLASSGQVELARLTGGLVAIFLIVVTLRIYLYMLLLEHDEEFRQKLYAGNRPFLFRLEFTIRCAAVVAVNFIYYSASRKYGHFQSTLVLTTALVFLWDLCMFRRLTELEALRGVFQRDFFLLVFALVYFYLEQYQLGPANYTPIPFTIIAAAGVGIFWAEMTSTYWGVIRRVCKSHSLVTYISVG